MTGPLVSIITPTFNSSRYIKHTIASVQRQSYENWELIVVDDCSSDSSVATVLQLADQDPRIRVYRQDANLGAGPARNRALDMSRGRFIAYLDADDIWYPQKLRLQIQFMMENQYGFTCTSYEVVDSNGIPLKKLIRMLPEVDYAGFLTNNLLQTVGIMVDLNIVDRALLRMPTMKRRQDAATWLQVLRAGHKNYGMSDILAQYRRAENSLSSNKLKAAAGIWYLYREVERLTLPFSAYCFLRYAVRAVWKRTYFRRMIKSTDTTAAETLDPN